MSVTMTRTEGATVLTLTSDPHSSLPPICQILKSLCYSPVWCSVSQRLKKIQGTSLSVLGTLQIMVGLLNIGIGPIVNQSAWEFWGSWNDRLIPFIFGGLSIFFGAMSILSEKFPSPCLVILNMILNVGGAGFSIAVIVIYSIAISHIELWSCGYNWNNQYIRDVTSSPVNESDELMKRKCLEAVRLTEMLLRSLAAVLIVSSVLQLCVTISSVVLGFKALCCREKRETRIPDDPECFRQLLDGVPYNSAY